MIPFPSHTLPRTDLAFADSVLQPFEHLLDFKAFASLRRMVTRQQNKPLLRRSDFMKQVTLYLPEAGNNKNAPALSRRGVLFPDQM